MDWMDGSLTNTNSSMEVFKRRKSFLLKMRLPIFTLTSIILSKITAVSLAQADPEDSGAPVDKPTDGPRGCRGKKYMIR